MYNKCNNVVAVSKQVKDDLIVSFGVRSENINVINNYVNSKDIRLNLNVELMILFSAQIKNI